MNNKTLKKLSVHHPYYCSDSNYFSGEANQEYETMTEFLAEYSDADIDMNLIFRWDIKPVDEELSKITSRYYAYVFIIKQRKGIFSPIWIKSINEEEAILFEELVKKHWEKLRQIWEPISNN